MKKEKKVVYGIEIVKPWSSEMYAHNEAVAAEVRDQVEGMWASAIGLTLDDFCADPWDENETPLTYDDAWDMDWETATQLVGGELERIQRAVTVHGFGTGYDLLKVDQRVMQELEDAPFYRLKDIAEELGLELEKGFVGL
jgi:hypothetical protein